MTQRLDCVAQVVESIKSKLSTVLSPAAAPASPAKLRGVVPAALTFMGAAFCDTVSPMLKAFSGEDCCCGGFLL